MTDLVTVPGDIYAIMIKICCSVPHGGLIQPRAMESWLNMITPHNHSVSWRFIYHYETAQARHMGLQWAEHEGAEWWFQSDSDCCQPSDVLTQLLSVDRPMVTGVYRKKQSQVAYELYDHSNGHYVSHTQLKSGVYPVAGAGMGSFLIHVPTVRSWPGPLFVNTLQSRTEPRLTEDLYFCDRVRSHGEQVWCHSECHITHVGITEWPVQDDQRDSRSAAAVERSEQP